MKIYIQKTNGRHISLDLSSTNKLLLSAQKLSAVAAPVFLQDFVSCQLTCKY